jgi:hypothetical protein
VVTVGWNRNLVLNKTFTIPFPKKKKHIPKDSKKDFPFSFTQKKLVYEGNK